MSLEDVKNGLKSLLAKMDSEEKELETPTDATDVEEVQRSLSANMVEYRKLQAEKSRLETLEEAKALRKTGSNLFDADNHKAPLIKVMRTMSRKDEDNSFRLWLTGGQGPDEWKYSADLTGTHSGGQQFRMEQVEKVQRTQTTSNTAGGYLGDVKPHKFERALKDFGGLWNLVNKEITNDPNDQLVTKWNPTALKAGYVAENTSVTTHSQVFAQQTIKMWALKSINFPISFESVLKSKQDLLALCEDSINEQVARQIATVLILGAGDGSTEGSGILTDTIGATDSGVTYTSTVAGKLVPSFFDDFFASFDKSAIDSPNFAVVSSNSTKFKLRGIVDTAGQPVRGYGYADGFQYDQLGGYRHVTDADMPNYPADTQTKKLFVAGDWSKMYAYLLSDRPQMFRETAFQADKFAYTVGGFQMFGCGYVDAGTHPIKYASVALDLP